MNPERWQQIRTVFGAALKVAPEDRPGFLDSACAGDPDLRSEVRSLLEADDAAGGFLESQVVVSDASHGAPEDTPGSNNTPKGGDASKGGDVWIGKQVGPYRILERIGFGGMGVVYRAVDTRLGREAALKFLSAEMQRDARARERFEREARAASLAQEIGEQAILAEAKNSLGEVRQAQANFQEARARYQEALALREGLGDQLGQGETRTSMGELSLSEGKPAEAEKLLTLARDAFHKANSQDQEITAAGDLARALLDQGKTAEAVKAIDSVRAAAKRAEDPFVRSNFLIEAARVDGFAGKSAEARATLDTALQIATAHGFVPTQLRARRADRS